MKVIFECTGPRSAQFWLICALRFQHLLIHLQIDITISTNFNASTFSYNNYASKVFMFLKTLFLLYSAARRFSTRTGLILLSQCFSRKSVSPICLVRIRKKVQDVKEIDINWQNLKRDEEKNYQTKVFGRSDTLKLDVSAVNYVLYTFKFDLVICVDYFYNHNVIKTK